MDNIYSKIQIKNVVKSLIVYQCSTSLSLFTNMTSAISIKCIVDIFATLCYNMFTIC